MKSLAIFIQGLAGAAAGIGVVAYRFVLAIVGL